MPQLAQGANTTLTMGVTDIVTIISNGGEYRVEQPAGTLLAIVGYTKTFGPFPTGGSLKITANLGSVLYDQATLRSNQGYVYLDSDSALKANGAAINVIRPTLTATGILTTAALNAVTPVNAASSTVQTLPDAATSFAAMPYGLIVLSQKGAGAPTFAAAGTDSLRATSGIAASVQYGMIAAQIISATEWALA